MDIETKEEFAMIYEQNPSLAMGLIFENQKRMEHQCQCRLENCNRKMKVLRAKNVAIQSGSGVVGGFLAWMAAKLGGG